MSVASFLLLSKRLTCCSFSLIKSASSDPSPPPPMIAGVAPSSSGASNASSTVNVFVPSVTSKGGGEWSAPVAITTMSGLASFTSSTVSGQLYFYGDW